jgi:hypothetical protein
MILLNIKYFSSLHHPQESVNFDFVLGIKAFDMFSRFEVAPFADNYLAQPDTFSLQS